VTRNVGRYERGALVGAGKATGEDRDYQVFCRDLLLNQYKSKGFSSYKSDGIDIRLDVGGTTRTIDVALVDVEGNMIVAECRRRMSKTKLMDIDAFAHRVELIRKDTGLQVAGVFFTKKQFQIGAVKSASWEGIDVIICDEGQSLQNFVLSYQLYDSEREKRLQHAQGYLTGGIRPTGSVTFTVIRKAPPEPEESEE
jgi:hypothetical protein